MMPTVKKTKFLLIKEIEYSREKRIFLNNLDYGLDYGQKQKDNQNDNGGGEHDLFPAAFLTSRVGKIAPGFV